jgi:hypothetical protein
LALNGASTTLPFLGIEENSTRLPPSPRLLQYSTHVSGLHVSEPLLVSEPKCISRDFY